MEKTLLGLLEDAFSLAIQKILPELSLEEARADMTPCQQEEFGHYQCNSAMRLAKVARKAPREIAEAILQSLDSQTQALFEKVTIAGPGFINIALSEEFLSKEVQKQMFDPFLGATPAMAKERVLVEFSSPNIAKEMHVGHIRSTIIGDCLARLFEFLGYDVLRLNHVGDWGTQFGMLITYMKEFASAALQGKETASLESLMGWYRAAKEKFDEDPEFKKRSQLEVVSLQRGDLASIEAWNRICDVSRKGFQEIYDLLDVKIEERGESFYNSLLQPMVKELEESGLITVSDGAKCIFLEGFTNREGKPLPMIVQKSDGGFNYDTTDMAAVRYRIQEDRADRIIVVTDVGQSLHFRMVFQAAEKAGWIPKKVRIDHVGFGLVLGPDGKKFKTRSGDTEKLIDLLKQAVDKAKELLKERGFDDSSEESLNSLAQTLGIGALKYADLSTHRTKDYTFSYDRMLRFEGNTAVFLLYAYVRINGIKRKTQVDLERLFQEARIELYHPSEISLGLHLLRFGEILSMVVQDLLPNHLTDYLYTLAEKFNAFFRDCRVEGVTEEASRLLLCEACSRVLKQGLEILGLKTVQKM